MDGGVIHGEMQVARENMFEIYRKKKGLILEEDAPVSLHHIKLLTEPIFSSPKSCRKCDTSKI